MVQATLPNESFPYCKTNRNKGMKKVLIICDLFPPAFGPRMGYLVKYLKVYGWESIVVTERVKEQTFAFMANECEVKAVDFYKNSRFRKLRWLLVFFGELLFNYKSRKIYHTAMELTKAHTFDLIVCSTYRSFPLAAAQKVAVDSGLPFVVDIRDIIEQYTGYEFISQPLPQIPGVTKLIASLFRRSSLSERNKALRIADHVITISPWHVNELKKYNPNITLIYNGYDPELFFPAPIVTDRFIISYTGRLLSLSMRNPELFLRAFKQLAEEGVFTTSDTRIEWYIDKGSEE